MAVIQSFGALQRVSPRESSAAEPVRMTGLDIACCSTYAAIYRTQPHVRTVVDFIARNIAQVGLHIYRRVTGTDRLRLPDHELALWLEHPNPDTTAYRLKESLLQDLGIYGMGYWLKVRLSDRLGLVRIAPEELTPYGWILPSGYVWTKPDGTTVELGANDVVAFRYFNPDDPLLGLSPLETLRQLLLEDATALNYRRAFWANAARLEGVITRPIQPNNKAWTPEQKQSFREQWQARYTGQPGQTAVLEDGMTFTPTSYSARDSEFTAARKLTREEVTAAYHCPLPMVGILDHATFSNIREQHKHLYQDCLGPTFEMLTQEIERQLLIECDDQDRVYVEANIADKLKGSFEEQAAAMRSAVGRPWMTANEGRARMNLPAMQNDPTADELAMPLNMSGAAPDELPAAEVIPIRRAALRAGAAQIVPVLRATWDRQREVLDKFPREAWVKKFADEADRWARELVADLEQQGVGAHAARLLAISVNADTLQMIAKQQDAFAAAREAALYVESGTP